MSRILVADDNSNIQKMVALALKDEGIDVVAVGNGDAAIRKIPDLRPDLVLADIFMPVRNGYEVCEFVKSDSRYMNTPVVLLVGAFDPLDEEETQRVRADGVLKKPFVPPDPLINMVKALLAKSSNGQKPAPAPPASVPKPMPQPAPQVAPASPAPEEQSPGQRTVQLPPQEEPPAVAAGVQSSTSAPETYSAGESDEVVTAPRDPNLGEPFWAAPEEPEEAEEPQEESTTDPEDMLDLHSFGKDESSQERTTSRFRPDSEIFEKAALLDAPPRAKEKAPSKIETPAAPAASSQTVESDEAVGDRVEAYSDEPVSSEPAPAEMPVEPFKFDPTLTFQASTESKEDAPQEWSAGTSPEEPSAPMLLPPIEAQISAADAKPEESSAGDEFPTISDSIAETPVTPLIPVDGRADLESAKTNSAPLPNRDAVITAATEAARMAFSELNTFGELRPSTENLDAAPKQSSSDPSGNRLRERQPAEDALQASPFAFPHAEEPPATPEMIEEVVNRLLERMQPQIMEVVNREVLRPAIEAMVRREMEKS